MAKRKAKKILPKEQYVIHLYKYIPQKKKTFPVKIKGVRKIQNVTNKKYQTLVSQKKQVKVVQIEKRKKKDHHLQIEYRKGKEKRIVDHKVFKTKDEADKFVRREFLKFKRTAGKKSKINFNVQKVVGNIRVTKKKFHFNLGKNLTTQSVRSKAIDRSKSKIHIQNEITRVMRNLYFEENEMYSITVKKVKGKWKERKYKRKKR